MLVWGRRWTNWKHCWLCIKTAPMLGETTSISPSASYLCFQEWGEEQRGQLLLHADFLKESTTDCTRGPQSSKVEKCEHVLFNYLSWRTPGLPEACSDVGASLEGNLPTQLQVLPSVSYTIPVASSLAPQSAKTFTLQQQTPILPIQNQMPQMTSGMEPVRIGSLLSIPLQIPNLIFSFLGSTIPTTSADHMLSI